MIRKAWNRDKWLLTTQVEHARIAGLIAASWNFPGKRPHDDVFLAISRHDDGWRPVDAAPGVTQAGAPGALPDMDIKDLLPIWSRSVQLLVDEGKTHAATLVASHFVNLARTGVDMSRLGARAALALGKFIGEQQAFINRQRGAATHQVASVSRAIDIEDIGTDKFSPPPAVESEEYERCTRFLQVCDQISLAICSDSPGTQTIQNVPYLAEGDTLTVTTKNGKIGLALSPLPFRKGLRDHLSAVIIPRKVYESPDELRGTIESVKPTVIEFHIGAGA
jgi:hypothetical protein